MRKLQRPRPAELAGALFSAAFAGITLVWLALDRYPPNWDDAWYLTNSLAVYDALTHGGIAGFLAKLNAVFGFKAPLIAALPTPFYLLFGRRWHAAYLVNIVSSLVLFWVMYRIASRWWSERAALIAVTLAGTLPLLYGLSRWYLVEYSMAALLGVSIWLLIDCLDFERRGMVIAFGILCGLGMLLKLTFVVFVLPVYLYLWVASRKRVRSLVLTAVPCVAVAMPWYVGHLRPTIKNALDAGYGYSAIVQGTGPIFAIGTIKTYLSHVIVSGISEYYGALMIFLIIWMAGRTKGRFWFRCLQQKPAGVLFFWMLPFVLFLFGGNKDIRYIAPILPAFALFLAWLLDSSLPHNLLGATLSLLLLVFPVVQVFSVSFGVPCRTNGRTYARRFTRESWPHDEILQAIVANTRLRPGVKEMLLVGADRAALNANNIELTVAALQLPFEIETTAHESSFDTLRDRVSHAAYFLYKDGGEPESPAFNPFVAKLLPVVVNDARFTEILARRLPDGGTVRVFKNSSPHSNSAQARFTNSGSPLPDKFVIDFEGMLAVTDFSAIQSPSVMTVQFQWRCLRPPDRDYWCFTHMITAEGRIVAQNDHRLLGGEPPLLSWRAGDSGREEIRLLLPAGIAAQGLQLRFGLYDPPSGDRLAAGSLQGIAASKFTLADRATAVLAAN